MLLLSTLLLATATLNGSDDIADHLAFEFTPYGAVHVVDEPRLLHTLDGVRGRDVR